MANIPASLKELPSNFRLTQIPSVKPQLLLMMWHTIRWPPVEWFIGRQDIVHTLTAGVLPACRRAHLIVTLYDLVWWRFPQGLNFWGRFFNQTALSFGIRDATAITTISVATSDDVLAYAAHRLSRARVRVIPVAADPSFKIIDDQKFIRSVCQKHGIKSRYILNIGTIEPRKNIDRLIRAYSLLEPELRSNHALVIVGPYGWRMAPIQTLAASLGLQKHVIWTGRIPDKEIMALLSGATVFAYPSLYEGFGLPILEAMHCDVPVITSNTSSMPEVAGDAALLVNPKNVNDIAQALKRVLTDDDLRDLLIKKARSQRTHFSYARMASEVLDLYKSIG